MLIKPFKSARPSVELAHRVAALPYDVMNSAEAREMVKDNPYSFLHIDKAEIDLDPAIDLYDDAVYAKARENLAKFTEEGTFIQDTEPCYYIYRQIMNGRAQTGLVACASIDDYLSDKIKKHELTLEAKEKDRIRHIETTNANTGPIFLTYNGNEAITLIINDYAAKNAPTYDFTTDDNISHTVWVINDPEIIDEISRLFQGVDTLYIADGHHRAASAVKAGLKRRNGDYDGEAEFNFFLSVIFPGNELYIMDYNRAIKILGTDTPEEFIELVKKAYDMEETQTVYKPQKLHETGMYLSGKWYKLTAKESVISADPVKSLDVSILQDNILTMIGITDPRTDKNIGFIGGIRGLSELERLVDSGAMKAAFAMFPTPIEQLFSVSDAGLLMPPKSTWFEPKLRSGLFIHYLD